MTRRPPAARLAAAANIASWDSFRFSPAELTELRTTDLTELIVAYETAARSAREIHDQLERLAADAPERICIMCGRDRRARRQGGLLRALPDEGLPAPRAAAYAAQLT